MKCPGGRISFVLAVTCAVVAGVLCPYSWWLVESPRKGEGGILSEIYGSGGLLLASILALCGVVSGIVSIRKTRKTDGSSGRMGWSVGVLIICSLLFVIALIKFLQHEF